MIEIDDIRELVKPGCIIPVPFSVDECGVWIKRVQLLLNKLDQVEKERDDLRNALEAIRDFKLGNALVHVQTLKDTARLALGGYQ
ncbi:hypothetical protein [Paenibacillus harenae]|uniref:hypothetical protein n=1 Tax=Paenibacillus harenae TaxID=306543 RepID=UPI00278DF0C9|nr:hypothetical protein [Paenibacillus harenae]MDQ0062348.1 hypothetical protein [Paenibacillus harenae]